MRSKKMDIRLARRNKAKNRKRPYGGKVLQRLFAYLDERNPALSGEAVAMLAVPQSVQVALGFVDKPAEPKARGGRITKRRASATTVPAAKRYAATITKVASALASEHAAPPLAAWQPLGPSLIPNGQTYGTNKIDVIGRVSSIAVDPSNAAHLLLGAAGGGVWESNDRGATWAPRTDTMPSNAIGAIAFDPTDTRKVFVGSGEGNFYFNLGAGVYASTDGGTCWNPLSSASFPWPWLLWPGSGPCESAYTLRGND
jgi:hypothetical protein